MRSTLFIVPHSLLGWPIFGWGLALAALIVGLIFWIAWALVRKRPTSEILSGLPVWGIAALMVVFVLPSIEQRLPDGTPLGLPIRGYGVLVLTGLLFGIGITVHRGHQLKIHPDTIIGLGFWMMLGGVLGARIFYVVQKWQDYDALTISERIIAIAKLTEGGLVIYGGAIGGLVAGAWFCSRHRLKLLATADLIAPGFLIGLAFGRIGCLLHGCCFGGVCQAELPTIRFPEGSVPYEAQLVSGELLGIHLQTPDELPSPIRRIIPDSPAEQRGLQAGQMVYAIRAMPLPQSAATAERPEVDPTPPGSPQFVVEVRCGTGRETFLPSDLPTYSQPVHPSQIYASINAFLLALLVWRFQPIPLRDGVTFFLALLLYAISRFLLEWIRSDEAGQLGTQFSISQLVSLAVLAISLGALVWLRSRPPGRVWNWELAT